MQLTSLHMELTKFHGYSWIILNYLDFVFHSENIKDVSSADSLWIQQASDFARINNKGTRVWFKYIIQSHVIGLQYTFICKIYITMVKRRHGGGYYSKQHNQNSWNWHHWVWSLQSSMTIVESHIKLSWLHISPNN